VNPTIAIVIIAVVAVAAIAAFFFWQKRRSQTLREKFGPEYERTVEKIGDRRRAETELEKRQKRVESLKLQALNPEEQRRFAQRWRSAQAFFVDEPSRAVKEADALVIEVMQARGYPMGDFEQRAADISVDHPAVVQHYRAARDIAGKNRKGEANTEDLRQAMVHYRNLFEELLGEKPVGEDNKELETESVR
jgi:hypothetical protein